MIKESKVVMLMKESKVVMLMKESKVVMLMQELWEFSNKIIEYTIPLGWIIVVLACLKYLLN